MTNENEDTAHLVDPHLLEKIEKRLREMQIEKKSIEISRGSIKGDNYLGIIAKIDIFGLTKQGKEVTLHWIAKTAPTQANFREVIHVDKCFVREIYMYQSVFPEFVKLQEDKVLKRPFKNFAPVYVTCLEELKECFVMENMKEQGYKLQDRFQPLDLAHVLLVMREYGRYHALSFALKDQKPEIFEKLASNTKENFFASLTQNTSMHESFERNVDKAIQAMDPITDGKHLEKLEKLKSTLVDTILEVLEPDAAGNFAVIGHGDSWMNNMLFKYGDECKPEVPSEMLFLDFQLSRIGSPCLDVSYFLLTCTDKPLRDQHLDLALEEYYKSFSSFLKELGSDPDVLFPKRVFEEHLKKFSVYGFIMSMMVLYLMMTESEEIPDWSNMTTEEMLASANFESTNKSQFEKRIRGVVLDCVQREFL